MFVLLELMLMLMSWVFSLAYASVSAYAYACAYVLSLLATVFPIYAAFRLAGVTQFNVMFMFIDIVDEFFSLRPLPVNIPLKITSIGLRLRAE